MQKTDIARWSKTDTARQGLISEVCKLIIKERDRKNAKYIFTRLFNDSVRFCGSKSNHYAIKVIVN